MRAHSQFIPNPAAPSWVTAVVRAQPEAPLMGPFMLYLLLLLIDDLFPSHLRHVGMAIRGVATLWVCWQFRHYFPPLGRFRWGIAIPAVLFAAWGWAAGQFLFDHWGLGGTLSFKSLLDSPPSLLAAAGEPFNPHVKVGEGGAFWTHVVIKIGVAITAVPIVEELFWRGFMLRAFISWNRWQEIPLGAFAWRAFVGTAVISVLQHPANWGVSVLCWLFFNALFYWTRSLACLMAVHGITNLALYAWVVRSGDWRFW